MEEEIYAIEAELTWTGEKFERNVRVYVGEDGMIKKIGNSEEKETDCRCYAAAQQALIPGMINCHSHAFQRGLRGKGEDYPNPTELNNSFWTWREEMYSLVGQMTEDQLHTLCMQCFSEMRQAGITTVGEFHYFHHPMDTPRYAYDRIVLQAAKEVGIRIVLLNAYYAHGGFNQAPMNTSQTRFKTISLEEYWENMDNLASAVEKEPTQTLGVVAHSLRAVDVETFTRLHEESVKRDLVFHMQR